MTGLPKTHKLDLELDNDWLTIWFNAPENRNALSDDLTGELRAVLETIKDDRSIRGVTFRGRNGIFCSGGDLKGMRTGHQGASAGLDGVVEMSSRAGSLFLMINSLPQVTIMLVEGAAMAGGLGIVCCGDIVAVTQDARFALTETTLGITPAQIAPYIVQRLGLTTARRLMLTAARFKGADAETIGLANFVADDVEALDAYEQSIRADVRRCAPHANAITKEIVLAAADLPPDQMIAKAAMGFATCLTGDEGKEGIAAFIEKRKPKWATDGTASQ